MLIKSSAIDRFLRDNPELGERRFGLPLAGNRLDMDRFNPTVEKIADAINFYGYEVRDADICKIKDIDLGSGNPLKFKPFPLCIDKMKEWLESDNLYSYPYTEGADSIRKELLDYVESLGFINDRPYPYKDVDDKGLSVHNITFMPSTSMIFNIIINIISRPGDVLLVTGPNYGLFTIRAERCGAEVDILPLEKEDNFLVNPDKLASRIDEINESLQKVYNRRKGYVPRVVAFLNANPNNPTGKVMGEKDVELLTKIGNVCNERGVFVIDDMVYRDITFDENNIAKPIATIPGMFRNTISLFGLSKSYGLASLRAGFVVADELIIREVINRIFQEIDSSPSITGYALAGGFNASTLRKDVYDAYFKELRGEYKYRYNLLKALVDGIDTVDNKYKEDIIKDVESVLKDKTKIALKGLPLVTFPENLKTESGFFAILDFTKIKGMKYKGRIISTERDLLKFFYKTGRIRFLVGQSISWPYEDELVGRVNFALDKELLINALYNMGRSLELLTEKEDYIIRFNRLEDQEQMAKIKIEGYQNTYDGIITSTYLKKMDVKEQTERYYRSFEEYKYRVLVAVRDNEVLGYSCFDPKEKAFKYDSELESLYIKQGNHNKGIGTSLFIETAKQLLSLGKRNMIVWCLKDNKNAIKFYESLGGIKSETKLAKIGEDTYEEYGFYFDLEEIDKDGSF